MRLGSVGDFGWTKYALAAVVIHAAVLSIPVSQKAARVSKQNVIDIIVMRQETPPAPPPAVEKQVQAPKPVPPKIRDQLRVKEAEQLPPAPQVIEKRQEPAPAGSGNVLDEEIAAQVRSGPATGGGEGVAISGVNVAGGKIGPGGGETGTGTGPGASSATGVGTGTAAGAGSGTGGGPVEARFGQPDGPQFAHAEMPEYPFAARRLGKEGKVVLEVFVDERGRLVKADVIEATDQMFAQSALEAMKKSKFRPASRNGSPVASRATLRIPFVLRKGF